MYHVFQFISVGESTNSCCGCCRVYCIFQAAFVLFFDENRPIIEYEGSRSSEQMAVYCKDLLHGNGYTRWFDKSLTCVIYDNGKVGPWDDGYVTLGISQLFMHT